MRLNRLKNVVAAVGSAALISGGMSATMEVRYDTRKYSITYKDSRGLDYNGSQIHRIYNSWVQNFDNRIREQ